MLAIVLGALLPAALAMWLVRYRRARGQSHDGVWVAWAAICGVVVAALLVSIVDDAALELNPMFTERQVAGTWRHRGATLTLLPTGEYTCVGGDACALLRNRGQWRREGDFELAFHHANGTEAIYRVVTFRGVRRLTQIPDIELWTRDLTFQQIAPGS